jgi:hypothetical protein
MTTRLRFAIEDFAQVLRAAGEDLVLIGDQALAVWVNEYRNELACAGPLLSNDIEFWGDREMVTSLAETLDAKADFPNSHSLTVLSGQVRKVIKGETVEINVLHTVPGLDQLDPNRAAIGVKIFEAPVRVLDPVSLIATAFHRLRNFDRTKRNDEEHSNLCIRIASHFIGETFEQCGVRIGLSYVKRLLDIASIRSNQKAIEEYSFRINDAFPIETIRRLSRSDIASAEERERLLNFLESRWPRLQGRIP